MKVLNFEQRSPAWYAARIGRVSGSNADRLLTPAKRKTYAQELLAETLTGFSEEVYVNGAMLHGIECEAQALAWYSLEYDVEVETVGLCVCSVNDRFIASPDGLIKHYGLVEVKCPSTKNFLAYREEGPPSQYLAQMQWQMFVCNRSWCDFVIFDPRLPFEYQGHVRRIERDNDMMSKLIHGAEEVLKYIDRFGENK